MISHRFYRKVPGLLGCLMFLSASAMASSLALLASAAKALLALEFLIIQCRVRGGPGH